ncbi:TPA: biotin-dependent carboxyltransferase family protein [Aeromonas dhakensis]|uniref:5-oxoprolinase subunit C family protein n=1 Tax=Aeromonas dhakensis TaxID=196024 RepID=UPI00288CABD1|nr:biotin-dependent carboxyltransferase family protein [Aeromonas dhakensis]
MFEVLRAGVLTTVQDLGRQGYRHLGVALCGALDPEALICGNRLVGNEPGCAGLEVTFGPVELRFLEDGWLALTGADFEAVLDDIPIWCGWSHPVRAGQTLKLRGTKYGMRAYLALSGGIDVPLVMGSRSTDLKAGFGGFKGRALLVGDRLSLGTSDYDGPRRGGPLRYWHSSIRVLTGPDWTTFAPPSQQVFWQQEWLVSQDSNRMGYRLQGDELHFSEPLSLLSHAVWPGIIQVPPSGQPIVLMADAQTTGGYPRVGQVIEADLWLLAQSRPGTRLKFVPCSLAEAQDIRRGRAHERYRFELALGGMRQKAEVWQEKV